MKVLVTGGSGFIGHNVVVKLVGHGHEVLNLDLEAPPQARYRAFWKKVDLLDKKGLEQSILQFMPETVIHLAARTDLDGDTLEDYSANTLGTENLLTICKSLTTLKKLIVASSMLVCKTGYRPESDQDYQADTVYGQSKVITEQLVRAADLPCTWLIIRPTSIWGPWFKEPYRNFFDLVLKRRFFRLGKRSSTKTFGYIGNTVHQIQALLHADATKVHKRVFYLGDPALNIDQWAGCICERANFPAPPQIPFVLLKFASFLGDLLKFAGIKFPLTSFRLRNMTISYEMDITPVQEIAGQGPFSLDEGVDATLQWLKNAEN